ncbi:universal stress protein [Haloarcula sp. JP-L23]|uniref:universal stress protein n=1 Tax=Haloarcula sp. JP-L23 TaxID=2716717 RepID=UPI00140EE0DD|nr:universal stress protein [Haloarcula sp. JP-L23]
MTFVVPFDDSAHARAALVRAREFADALDEDVLAISVVPNNNVDYARKAGWLGPEESFDLDAIVASLERAVHDIAPEARFEYETCVREATGNRIAKPIRKFARHNDASMVFVGSANAGRLVTTLGSVAGRISTDAAYDVVIVRRLPET